MTLRTFSIKYWPAGYPSDKQVTVQVTTEWVGDKPTYDQARSLFKSADFRQPKVFSVVEKFTVAELEAMPARETVSAAHCRAMSLNDNT